METKKEENPLFGIARKQHKDDYLSNDFQFLKMAHSDEENTYTLAFCRGVSYATLLMQKQINELQTKLKELETKKEEV